VSQNVCLSLHSCGKAGQRWEPGGKAVHRAGERSSSKTGPVSVRCDGATARGLLTVKSERPGSFRKR